jgi:SH3 domain-containing YSC84-like protein 1
MKLRSIPAAFISLLLLAPVGALAASGAQNRTASRQSQAPNASDARQVLADSVKVIEGTKSDAQFRDLMKRAKGVFVVPDLIKGAIVVGGSGGQGVLLARRGAGWSDPAFLSVGSISIGAQAGGEAGPLIFLLMTDKALNDLIDANNFSLNANAGLTIVNYSAKTQGGFGKGDIVVWSGASGAFAGATISGSDITQNAQEDQSFYGRAVSTKQIIDSVGKSAAAAPLREALPG